jgi:actin cytoskeleton-regulatory complex protein PAN1
MYSNVFSVFTENNVLIIHPSKSGGDWWYGTSKLDGKSGFVPKTFVQILENGMSSWLYMNRQQTTLTVKAKALYPYTANNADELTFDEGEELIIVDRSDAEWWKVEQGGMVFVVPATFLEIVEG